MIVGSCDTGRLHSQDSSRPSGRLFYDLRVGMPRGLNSKSERRHPLPLCYNLTVHRKEIDAQEFDHIRVELLDREEITRNTMVVVIGRHEVHGQVIMIRQHGRFWCDAHDVSRVKGFAEAGPYGMSNRSS